MAMEIAESGNGSEIVQRAVASQVATAKERDALSARVQALNIEIQGKDTEIKVLRDMLTFNEEQAKARNAAEHSRVLSYQSERDLLAAECAAAEQKFVDLYKAFVGVLQAFRAQEGELVRKATTDANGSKA